MVSSAISPVSLDPPLIKITTRACPLDLRLECAMQGVDLSASDRTVSLRLVIIGGEAEEGKVMMLERESPNIWRQMSLAEL